MNMEKTQEQSVNNIAQKTLPADESPKNGKQQKYKYYPVLLYILLILLILLLGIEIYQIFWGLRAENRALQKRLDHAESLVRMQIDENENMRKTVESLKKDMSKIYSSQVQKTETPR